MERLTKYAIPKLGKGIPKKVPCFSESIAKEGCPAMFCNKAKKCDSIQNRKCPYLQVMDKLAAYEDAMPLERAQELAQAEKDGRLVVLEPAAREGEKKPHCFYNDMGQALCLGFARGEYDDEPIDRCKECWYCKSTREEAEAALKKREEADNEAD